MPIYLAAVLADSPSYSNLPHVNTLEKQYTVLRVRQTRNLHEYDIYPNIQTKTLASVHIDCISQ